MAIPIEQVVEIRASRPDGEYEVGSGLLLPGGLALTAAHVVFSKSGMPHDPVLIRLAGEQQFVAASVTWPTVRGDADAALLKITATDWVPPRPLRAVRWGRITGAAPDIPCDAIGFPRVLRDEKSQRDTDHMVGSIHPGAQQRTKQYNITVRSRHPEATGKPWAGMSGAALFSQDLLIGIVVIETPGYAGESLTAEPVVSFASDPGFAARIAGQNHLEIESVELSEMFGPPARRSDHNQSPGKLLDPVTEIVPFRGREDLLLRLQSWCEADDFAARLIVGPGGQGKTRLARELCHRLRRSGWVAGFVHERTSPEVVRRLTDTREPVLLVVDASESREDQIIAFIESAWRRPENSRAIRLLMLARTDGDWWDQLRRKMPEPLRFVVCEKLPPLEQDQPGRRDAYQAALGAFTDWLAEEKPGTDWPRIASQLVQPDLAHAEDSSVLTLHMAALNELLQAGPGEQSDGIRPEDVLLDHEEQYWGENKERLEIRDLRRAIAAAALCGAGDDREAVSLLAGLHVLRQWKRAERVQLANLIQRLYPPSSGQFWGYLQPDRVGEHLIRRVTKGEPGFADDAMAAASAAQREHAKAVCFRIGARCEEDRSPEARQWYARAAAVGHMAAAYQLGNLLLADAPSEARRCFEQAANAGHNDAAKALGDLLQDSVAAEARQWYERAAIAGHTEAAFQLGMLLWKQNKPAEAKPWLMRAAAADHAEAAYELGWLFEKVEHDEVGTKYWWRTSSGLGWHGAAFWLADHLESDGKPEEAKSWYEIAAPGHQDAAVRLARLLNDSGKLAEAKHWYEHAARQGHAQAAFELGELMLKSQDIKGVQYWWAEAYKTGYPAAEPLAIAESLWSNGWPAEAREWYELAASQGVHWAAHQLSYLSDSLGDPGKASYWRSVAAELAAKRPHAPDEPA